MTDLDFENTSPEAIVTQVKTNMAMPHDSEQAIADAKLMAESGRTAEEVRANRPGIEQELRYADVQHLAAPTATLEFLMDKTNAAVAARRRKSWESLGNTEAATSYWVQGIEQGEASSKWETIRNLQMNMEHASTPEKRAELEEQLNQQIMDFANFNKYREEQVHPPLLERLQNPGSASNFFKLVFENPGQALSSLAYVTTTSVASAWKPLAANVAASFLPGGAPAVLGRSLATGAMGMNSYTVDRGATALEELTKRGVDLTNPELLSKVIKDPKAMDEIDATARGHALPVAAFDMLSMLVAGTSMRSAPAFKAARSLPDSVVKSVGEHSLTPLKEAMTQAFAKPAKSTFLTRLDDFVTSTVAGAGLGMAGEYAGQVNAGQEISIGDILLEGFGELGGMPIEIASARAGRMLSAARDAYLLRQSLRQYQAGQVAQQSIFQSHLRQDSPERFKSFMEGVAKGLKDPALYVKAEDLKATEGFAERLAAVSPEYQTKVENALKDGTTVSIPLMSFVEEIGKDEELLNMVREASVVGENGMSKREIDEYVADRKNRKAMEQAQAEADRQAKLTPFAQSLQELETVLVEQLTAKRTEGMTPEAVNAQARVFSNMISKLAMAEGKLPMEYYEANALNIDRPAIDVVEELKARGATGTDDAGNIMREAMFFQSLSAARTNAEAWDKANEKNKGNGVRDALGREIPRPNDSTYAHHYVELSELMTDPSALATNFANLIEIPGLSATLTTEDREAIEHLPNRIQLINELQGKQKSPEQHASARASAGKARAEYLERLALYEEFQARGKVSSRKRPPTAEKLAELKATLERREAEVAAIENYDQTLEKEIELATQELARVNAAVDRVVNQMTDNLLFMFDLTPDKSRIASAMWYYTANKIAALFAERYGISLAQAAALLAVHSPQTEWDMNVALAEHTADIVMSEIRYQKPDAAMVEFIDKKLPLDDEIAKKRKDPKEEAARLKAVEEFNEQKRPALTQSLDELIKAKNYTAAGIWVRAYSETHLGKQYRRVYPKGGFGETYLNTGGDPKQLAWGSTARVANAIQVLTDGSMASIDAAIGSKYKVRNFYNNIYNPDLDGPVTIDTHAIAAALMLAIGSSDDITKLGFGYKGTTSKYFGQKGATSFITEAYRRAAKQKGLKALQMQAIVWMTVREAFADKSSKGFQERIIKLWKEAEQFKGDETARRAKLDEIRKEIMSTFNAKAVEENYKEGDPTITESYDRSEIPAIIKGTPTPEVNYSIEVAPNPDDRVATQEWNALPPEEQQRITNEVLTTVINEVASREKVHLDLPRMQLGGFEDGTQLSTVVSLVEAPEKARRIGAIIAKVLDQKSVWVASGDAKSGMPEAPAVVIALPADTSYDDVSILYKKYLRVILDENGNNIIGGCSFSNGRMTIGLDPSYNVEEVIAKVKDALVQWNPEAVFDVGDDIAYQGEVTPNDLGVEDNAREHSDSRGVAQEVRPNADDYIDDLTRRVREKIRSARDEARRGSQSQGGSGSQDGVFHQGQVDPKGAYSPETNTITLFRAADASTFMHESAHWWLTNAVKSAIQIIANKGNALNEAERDLINTLDGFLRWMGIEGNTAAERIQNWNKLTVEEQRAGHEQFARGFESYLRTGRAPLKGLRLAFQKFKSWLCRIYQDARQLNVEMTPEVMRLYDLIFISEAEANYLQSQTQTATPFTAADLNVIPQEDIDALLEYDLEALDAIRSSVFATRERNLKILTNRLERERRGLEKKFREIIDAVRDEIDDTPLRRAEALLTGRDPTSLKISRRRTHGVLASEARRKAEGQHIEERYQEMRRDAADLLDNDLVVSVRRRLDSGFKLVHSELEGMVKARSLSGETLELLDQRGWVGVATDGPKVLSIRTIRKGNKLSNDIFPSILDRLARLPNEEELLHDIAVDNYIAKYGYISVDDEPIARYKLNEKELRKKWGLKDHEVRALRLKGYLEEPDVASVTTAELLADTVGSDNPYALLKGLASAMSIEEEAEVIATERFAQKYGDLPDEQGLTSLARSSIAVSSDAYTKRLATELNIMIKLLNSRGPRDIARTRTKMMENEARLEISAMHPRDIRPSTYEAASRSAGKRAIKLWKDGDYEGALKAKHDQLAQHLRAKEAKAAIQEIERRRADIKRELKSKSIDGGYMEQAENLASRFDLSNLPYNKQAPGFPQFLMSAAEEGYTFEVPQFVYDRGGVDAILKELTYDEFKQITDLILSILHVGREKNSLLVNGRRVLLNDAAKQVTEQIEKSSADMGRVAKEYNDSDQQPWYAGILNFFRSHIKIASWVRIMDGNKDGGVIWNMLIRRANECANLEAKYRQDLTQRLADIFTPLTQRFKMNEVVGEFKGKPLTRAQRFVMALNWGNDGNRQRLRDGFKLTDKDVEDILAGMTAQEWRAVEGVWKTFESLRPEMEALERRQYGRSPEWIEYKAFDVQTVDGPIHVSGGYYPAVYDIDANPLSEEHFNLKDAEAMMGAAMGAVRTDRGHMKHRAAKVNRPITLRYEAMVQALNTEVHDLCWREFVIDATRLMKKIDRTIRMHYSPEVLRLFNNWIKDIALGDMPTTGRGAAIGRLRRGVGIAGLGFNIVSAIAQSSGITFSAARLGKHILPGMTYYLSNPKRATMEANEASPFMRRRAMTRFRELNEVNNIIRSNTVTDDALEKIRKWAYWPMLRVQQVVDTITWHAAHIKAIQEGEADATAIAIADQTVIDTQGGGELKDLSQVERSENLQLFTVFYSAMNAALNLNATAFMGEKNRAKAMASILMVSVVGPVLEGLLRSALPADRNDDDDDDDEDWIQFMRDRAGDVVGFNLGTVVMLRELSGLIEPMVKGDKGFGYSGPGGTRVINDVYKTAMQAQKGEVSKAFIKSSVSLAGSLFGLPAVMVNRVIDAGDAVIDDDIEWYQFPQAAAVGVEKPQKK